MGVKRKITDEQVEQIEELCAQNKNRREIAQNFGISKHTVDKIAAGDYERKFIDDSPHDMRRLYETCRRVMADGYGVDYGRWMADHKGGGKNSSGKNIRKQS